MTSLQQRLVKTGGRLIKHARYYRLLLPASHLTRRLFNGMLQKIAALPVAGGIAEGGGGFQIECEQTGRWKGVLANRPQRGPTAVLARLKWRN